MKYLKNFTKTKKLVTHNGSFHADDIFATATLSLVLDGKIKVVRTRDEKKIEEADYAYDVGGIYDPDKNRFDHHQKGGAGARENGIPYASFGLVWKKFGIELTGSSLVVDLIDKHIVAPIDASDNGYDLVEKDYDVSPFFFIQEVFTSMYPTWREKNVDTNKIFMGCVEVAKQILIREIIHEKDAILAEEEVASIYNNTEDKRILVLDKNYPCEEILNDYPEPLFVIYPRESDGYWGVKAVRENPMNFKNRKNFPESWGGLRDEPLQKVTGVPDAVFCHRALFLAVAKSKGGAIKLAKLAL